VTPISSTHLNAWSLRRRSRDASRRGVAALEFALTAPMLIVLLMSMYDVTNGWLAWQRMAVATRSVGQIATLMAVNADGSNLLSQSQAWRASTAVYAAMPELSAAGATFGVTMTEVEFLTYDTCTVANCVADVSWSVVLLGVAPPRLCGTLSLAADTAAPALSALPASAFQEAPMLVVDLTNQFTPLFFGAVTGAIPMTRSAYLPVRSGILDQSIDYEDTTLACPAPPTPCTPKHLKGPKRGDGAQKGAKQDDVKCKKIKDNS